MAHWHAKAVGPLEKRSWYVWLTLPYKGLAGVQEDVAALHNHALNGKILTDVLSVTHFIMHHSENEAPPKNHLPLYNCYNIVHIN